MADCVEKPDEPSFRGSFGAGGDRPSRATSTAAAPLRVAGPRQQSGPAGGRRGSCTLASAASRRRCAPAGAQRRDAPGRRPDQEGVRPMQAILWRRPNALARHGPCRPPGQARGDDSRATAGRQGDSAEGRRRHKDVHWTSAAIRDKGSRRRGSPCFRHHGGRWRASIRRESPCMTRTMRFDVEPRSGAARGRRSRTRRLPVGRSPLT